MSEEERFKLENELLMTKSKAQMINLYLDKLEELQQKENIIKEVRELVENDIDFKCITFRKADEDTWKLILASNIKEDFLEILEKENI